MEIDKKITILGAGPAGLGVAYFCEKATIDYQLFEMNSYVGGNCTTFNIDDFLFDSGAHRFHDKNKDVTNLVKSIMGSDLRRINVPSQIFIRNQFIDFPLSPISLIKFMGLFSFIKESIKLAFIKIKYLNKPIDNFKDFSISKYGESISELFLLGYSEKLWGKKSNQLSIDIAGKRLNGLNVISFILELFNFKNLKVRHLDGSFYYPEYGIGSLFESIYAHCNKESIHLDKKVTKIYHANGKINSVELNSNQIYKVDRLVSSLPLDLFIKLLDPVPPDNVVESAKSIKYRNMILVIFMIDKEKINDNGSMYFPSDDFIFTRIYEPRNRSAKMSPVGKTSLVVEVPCDKNDLIWINSKDEDIIKNIKNQLIALNFFKDIELLQAKVIKLYNAYPVLDKAYTLKIDPIISYLDSFENLSINGRNGKYKYTHIHDHLHDSMEIINSFK